MTSQLRQEILFSGDVQGVGFRYTTRQIAQALPVTGFVKNLPDGRVQLVVESDRQTLAGLLRRVEQAMDGYIQDKQVSEAGATGEFTAFEIRF